MIKKIRISKELLNYSKLGIYEKVKIEGKVYKLINVLYWDEIAEYEEVL